jgi:hypothetical protein
MLRKFLTLGSSFILAGVLAPTQVFAGIIEVNINGGGWVAVAPGALSTPATIPIAALAPVALKTARSTFRLGAYP